MLILWLFLNGFSLSCCHKHETFSTNIPWLWQLCRSSLWLFASCQTLYSFYQRFLPPSSPTPPRRPLHTTSPPPFHHSLFLCYDFYVCNNVTNDIFSFPWLVMTISSVFSAKAKMYINLCWTIRPASQRHFTFQYYTASMCYFLYQCAIDV